MPDCCVESTEDGDNIFIYCSYKQCETEFCGQCRQFIISNNSSDCECSDTTPIEAPDEFDHPNNQRYFEEVMNCRNQKLRSIYATGIKGLDEWYGDKSYREFESWAVVIDSILERMGK